MLSKELVHGPLGKFVLAEGDTGVRGRRSRLGWEVRDCQR